MHLFIQMNPEKNRTKTYEALKQPFPALLRDFIIVAILAVTTIVISAVFYFQATVIAVVALLLARKFLITRDKLTFIKDEYDLDIYVEEKLKKGEFDKT